MVVCSFRFLSIAVINEKSIAGVEEGTDWMGGWIDGYGDNKFLGAIKSRQNKVAAKQIFFNAFQLTRLDCQLLNLIDAN